ncbi:cytosolic carboxypeptidase 3 isoform X9 [Macaca fascicularis]|uniref:cytosolic carboxypeptidase 3 isoform X9 n=1 Tax=Macaca fascicularis TaxID=9541 RepID=UPI003D157D6A
MFSFSACKFNVQKSKEGTGRVVMWKMGIRNSFTMEATFCGSTLGNKRGTHFSTKDLESMGYHFCDSLLDYCDPDRTKYYRCLKELEEMERHITLEKVFEDSDTPVIHITLDLESSRGSDSSESIDSLTDLLKLTSQKKHLKTKKERNSTTASHQNAREGQEIQGQMNQVIIWLIISEDSYLIKVWTKSSYLQKYKEIQHILDSTQKSPFCNPRGCYGKLFRMGSV